MALDSKYKQFVATKLRAEHPELESATDDQLIQTIKDVELPEASDEQWEQVLQDTHPMPKEEHKGISDALVTGAVGLGIGALAGAAHLKSRMGGEIGKTIAEAPMKLENPVGKISELATEPPPEATPQPFTHANHVSDPEYIPIIRRIENDPEFKDAVTDLGGGKTISHQESLEKALLTPPMTVDELASWNVDKPTNQIDIIRANLLRAKLWDTYSEATAEGNPIAEEMFNTLLTKVEPGYNVLKGIPGRSTEIMSLFKYNEEVGQLMSELKSIGAPPELIRKKVNEKLASAPDEIKKTGFVTVARKKIEEYATAVKLMSAVTHGVNSISNGLTFLHRTLLEKPAQAFLLSTGIGGVKDPIAAEAILQHTWPGAQGFIDAARNFIPNLLDPFYYKDASKIEVEILGKNPPPVWRRYFSPFRWLYAADQFWKTIIIKSELNTKAFMQASEEGLTGDLRAQRIKELVENSETPWYKTAFKESEKVAKEYTFQEDPDRVLKPFIALQNIPLMKIVFPFVRTPYNITKFYLQRSLFGIGSRRFYRDIQAGGLRRSEAISRLGVGLGITGATFALVNLGHLQLTGAYPKNRKEALAWKAEKKAPWSLKIGDFWISYNRFQPLGLYLTTIAAINEGLKENKFEETEHKIGKVLYQLIQGPLDMPFLQGMSALMDVLSDPESNLDKFEQLIATGFFPNFLRDVRIQMDPVQRKPQTNKEAIENIIPGLSQNVQPNITVLGEEVKLPESRILRATKMFSQSSENEKTKLMEEIGWAPPSPRTDLEFKNIELALEGDTKTQFLKDMGQAASKGIEVLMKHPKFNSLSNDLKKEKLSLIVSKLQRPVRKKYLKEAGIKEKIEEQKEIYEK